MNEDYYKEEKLSNGNIKIESNNSKMSISIIGGVGFHIEHNKLFINHLNLSYGLHPVTGKPMNENDFDLLAKEQNWTPIEILNNLNNVTTTRY